MGERDDPDVARPEGSDAGPAGRRAVPRGGTSRTDRADLARSMARLAEDAAMIVPFVADHGDRLADVVRRHLWDLGRPDVARDGDEVQGLVWDAALVLRDNAAGWDPSGALPWTWAWRPIRSQVASAIGHARADVEPDELELVAPSPCATAEPDLEELARAHDGLRLVLDALAAIDATVEQRQVHLEYRIQKAFGDPSPARTVAAQFAMSEANVRQIDRRIRVKLSEVVAGDERFGPLRAIPWLDRDVLGGDDAARSTDLALVDAP